MAKFRSVLISWGPLGVFVMALVDSLGVPNPGGTDLLLLLTAIASPQSAWLCAGLAVLGSLIGSFFFLEITRRGGEKYLTKFTAGGRGLRFRAWFLRYGLITVFVPALLPIPILPYKVFAACAGAMGVSRTRFLTVVTAARIPRYFALAYLGAQLGESSLGWAKQHAIPLLAFAGALFVVLYLLVRWAERGETV